MRSLPPVSLNDSRGGNALAAGASIIDHSTSAVPSAAFQT